jgi:hypothetical protein
MRVVDALKQFRKDQRMTRKIWDRIFSRQVQHLLLAHFYAKVDGDYVFLTHEGLEVLGSTLAGG